MTAKSFSAQHRNRTGYDRCQSGRYVHGDKRQKERSVRRKWNAGDGGRIPDHLPRLRLLIFRFSGSLPLRDAK
jgi:hypothetical protein